MMSIYEKAKEVVVWLGEADSRSQRAMSLLKEFTTITDGECTEEAMVKSFEDPNTLSAWDDLFNLIERTWFQRLWVIQEVTAPKDVFSIQVLCGDDTILWAKFIVAVGRVYTILDKNPESVKSIRTKSNFTMPHLLAIMRMIQLREHHQNGAPLPSQHENLNSLYLVQATKPSHATVSHDRIYSLLGLIHDEENLQDLTPDYSKSATQVYKEFFKHVVEGSKSLLILAFARSHKYHLKDLHSWAPEWTEDAFSLDKILLMKPFSREPSPLTSFQTSLFKPTLNLPIQFRFSESLDVLHVHGLPRHCRLGGGVHPRRPRLDVERYLGANL